MCTSKNSFFSNLRSPVAHFRQQQGREQENALTSSVFNIPKTHITVNASEDRKRVKKNTTLGKQIKWFSEAIKELSQHY